MASEIQEHLELIRDDCISKFEHVSIGDNDGEADRTKALTEQGDGASEQESDDSAPDDLGTEKEVEPFIHNLNASSSAVLSTASALPAGVRSCISLQKVVISEDPSVVLFKDFLNDAEIDHLMKLAEGRFRASITGAASAYALDTATDNRMSVLTERQSSTRTSYSCVLDPDDAVVALVARRVAAVAELPAEHVERLSLLRYEPGQVFKLHHDGQFRPRTVFVYLNTLPEGEGETRFPHLGLRFRPTRGVAVMWTNPLPDGSADLRLMHEALPPATMVKYGLACFVNEKPRSAHAPGTATIVH
jgi:hypothetical protein